MVRFLNSVGGGRVTRLEGNLAYVEDEDGFETPVLTRECVVVGSAPAKKAESAPQSKASAPQAATVIALAPEPEPPLPVEETPEGDKINLVLAFEPRDIKSPTTSPIDIFIVNDSNYFLSFTYQTRPSDDVQWTCRYAGTVEPNIQLLLGELNRNELQMMDRVAVQYVAYKQDRPFEMKQPACVELPLDTTKFFKLHCYKENLYFDTPVISLDIVRDDQPQIPTRVDASKLAEAMNAKKRADERPPRRPVKKKQSKAEIRDGNIVVDLHIQELVDNTRGLSGADMLNLQIDEFRRVMDAHKGQKGCRIVFIHGKGEGVLRNALMKELNHRYKGNDVQDASFREYGFGATQVTIR